MKIESNSPRKSIVDFAFIGGASTSNLEQIPKPAEHGVIAFKTYMIRTSSKAHGLSEPDNYGLMKTLETVEKTGLRHFIHAEDQDLLSGLEGDLKSKGKNSPLDFCDSRPPLQEALGISRVIQLAGTVGARLVLAHLSSFDALELVRQARMQHVNITAEGRPEYFVFTKRDLERNGSYLKTVPPLREVKDVEEMWLALDDGTIDFVGSDHAPKTLAEKEAGRDNIWAGAAGTPSLELTMPLMFDKVIREGKSSLQKLVRAMSETPAKKFGLYANKGSLDEGADADIVIVDPTL